MGKVVGKQKIVRQPGFMYYIKDGYVMATPMKGKPGSTHKASPEHLPETKGHRAWVNKEGYVEIA